MVNFSPIEQKIFFENNNLCARVTKLGTQKLIEA